MVAVIKSSASEFVQIRFIHTLFRLVKSYSCEHRFAEKVRVSESFCLAPVGTSGSSFAFRSLLARGSLFAFRSLLECDSSFRSLLAFRKTLASEWCMAL